MPATVEIPVAPPAAPLSDVVPALKPETAAPADHKSQRIGSRSPLDFIGPAAFIAMHLACVSVFFVEFTWLGLGMMVGLYLIRGFGLTGGFHRYFSHRGYKMSRWFQFVIAWIGTASLQRGPMWWCAHHRLHHKHSDQEQDPHSPIVGSIFWSHVGWILSPRFGEVEWDQIRDWQKYPELKWLDKYDWLPGVLLGLGCLAVGVSEFVWAFVVGTVLLYHATFMVNSVCHLVGRRRFETSDKSRNNWFVAIFSMGEGWHNNHHHYPSAARQGFKWYEFDLSYCILKTLSWVGLVWDLRQPTPRALSKNLIGAAPAEAKA
ncbi:acyl-CoA desaturase [Fimbriiglobus ruber]|uniref:Fatty acid desaturase n=1 Tax=Fimbriiglobus ruber TaxID=1908690 RepID=A0A225DQ88_9BACT|nr:acyl-CoA desaturase [Fimbriiglobus ruber]OWK41784.1 Fatty acid desaturase [Fimbriiglobus ruber]